MVQKQSVASLPSINHPQIMSAEQLIESLQALQAETERLSDRLAAVDESVDDSIFWLNAKSLDGLTVGFDWAPKLQLLIRSGPGKFHPVADSEAAIHAPNKRPRLKPGFAQDISDILKIISEDPPSAEVYRATLELWHQHFTNLAQQIKTGLDNIDKEASQQ